MARLTIRAEGRQAQTAFSQLSNVIKTAAEETRALVAGTRQLPAAVGRASQSAATLARQTQSVATSTTTVARETRRVAANYDLVTRSAQRTQRVTARIRQDVRFLAQDARRAASALARAGRGVSGGVRSLRGGSLAGIGGAGARGLGAGGLASLFGGSAITRPIQGALTGAFVGASAGLPGIIAGGIAGGAGGIVSAVGDVFSRGIGIAINFLERGATVALIAAATAGAVSFKNAIEEQPLAEGFSNIIESRGIGEATEVLEGFREATRGTVSDLALLRNANNAFLLGAAETQEQFEFLIEAGRRLGKATGRDATEGIQDLALGIGRQSRLILDNLGLIVRVEEAQKRYAESVGTTASQLGENEKRLAFQTAAYESIRSKLAELGTEQDLAVDGIGRLGAAFTNLATAVGREAVPAITEVSNRWAEFLGSLSAEDVISGITRVGEAIRDGIGGAIDAAFEGEAGVASSVKAFGDSIFEALTDPSSEAFGILEIRFRGFRDIAISYVDQIFDRLRSEANEAIADFASFGLIDDDDNPFRDFRRGRERVGASNREATAAATEREVAEFRRTFAEQERAAERQETAAKAAADESERIKQNLAAVRESFQRGVSVRQVFEEQGLGAFARTETPGTGGPTRLEQAAAAEQAAREEREREAEIQKEIIAQMRDEVKERTRSIASLKKETAERDRFLEKLDSSVENLSAALEGEDKPTDLAGEINRLAEELRQFPDEFRDIRETIANINAEIADAQAQLSEDLNSAAASFRNDIQKRAREFLLGGGVEGETTRVRSLRRKAQRERRRRNREVFQRELGSRGFGGGLASIGGFGIQGVERSGGVLDSLPAGLESALQQIIGDDGGTIVADLQAQIADIVSRATEREEELNARKAEALAVQADAQERQVALIDEAIDLEAETIKLAQQLADEVSADKTRIARLENELEGLRRKIREAIRK